VPNLQSSTTRYTCHVTTPDGVAQPPATVRATDRLTAVREALAGYPAGSRASCRADGPSESARVAAFLAARTESFPLIGGWA